MQDAFAYCTELVRTADRDRFLAALFVPPDRRAALHALHAFNIEVRRVREAAPQALAGEIRLQWWREVVEGKRAEEAAANPVAAALLGVIERFRLPASSLAGLIEAHRFDLYDEPMVRMSDLDTYARNTNVGLIALAAQVLGGDADLGAAADAAGIALTIRNVLLGFPHHAAVRRLYVPLEVLHRHGAQLDDIFAGRSSKALRAAFAEMRGAARGYLAAAHKALPMLASELIPAFLPVALVRPTLDRLERRDPFEPTEIAPWRRQWLIWRAARNPARIAG